MAKRRMLILVRVAAPPPPPPPAASGADDAIGDADDTEIKTGFFGVASAMSTSGGASNGRGGSSSRSGSSGGSGGGSGGSGSGGMIPLGTCRQVIAALGQHNVGPDGSGPDGVGETPGMATLYGPGCVVEIPTGGEINSREELSQVMVTVTDEDFAWPVLSRLCKANSWKMMDPESGRMFG